MPQVRVRDDVNLRGLTDLMKADGLDAVVCRAGVNVSYLSGISTPGTLGRHLDLTDTPRETFVVWPATDDPVLITSEIASALAEATSSIATIETYADYREDPEAKLAEVLVRLGLADSRLGFDLAWFSATRWAKLNVLLPAIDCVDCTHELDLVRAIKTPAEVECLRSASALLDRCLLEVFETVRPGETEREVHARITARAIELGADSVHGILQTSTNQVLYGGESDLRLEAGAQVRSDYVLYLDGYAANLSRPLNIGRPSMEVEALYTSYLSFCREAVAMLRPGAAGGEVHRQIQEMLASRGWAAGPAISGHGIGRWFHQQYPMLVAGSSDVLEPGMVIALEPISGHWHLQDEFLITESEPTRISDKFEWRRLQWTG